MKRIPAKLHPFCSDSYLGTPNWGELNRAVCYAAQNLRYCHMVESGIARPCFITESDLSRSVWHLPTSVDILEINHRLKEYEKNK